MKRIANRLLLLCGCSFLLFSIVSLDLLVKTRNNICRIGVPQFLIVRLLGHLADYRRNLKSDRLPISSISHCPTSARYLHLDESANMKKMKKKKNETREAKSSLKTYCIYSKMTAQLVRARPTPRRMYAVVNDHNLHAPNIYKIYMH